MCSPDLAFENIFRLLAQSAAFFGIKPSLYPRKHLRKLPFVRRLQYVVKNAEPHTAVAAMPVTGSYRAIDFSLSNMTNSHIQKVAVFTQYNSRSLNEHLNSSKWWDFGRKQGGLYVFTPTITSTNSYWYQGTADALYQNISFLKDSHEPYVVIASGDGIYKLDYNKSL